LYDLERVQILNEGVEVFSFVAEYIDAVALSAIDTAGHND
jgi:hypothetical protein